VDYEYRYAKEENSSAPRYAQSNKDPGKVDTRWKKHSQT